ncbi:MAG TPA: hypothetical protein DDZ40_06955 [Deltaproteobacteria bacterium]|nr:hypothetical protein [Deltaproteobacteria bacterium]
MSLISVTVKFFGSIGDRFSWSYDHERGICVALHDGLTIEALLQNLGLSGDEVGLLVVRGLPRALTHELKDADEVSICLSLAKAGGVERLE